MAQLFEGFEQEEFVFEEHETIVVLPHKWANRRRVALKTEYWGAFPNAERMLLEHGFAVAYIRNDNRFGTEPDLKRKAALLDYLSEKYGTEKKCIPVGMSCGGLIAVMFAAYYPEYVSCLYLDAPVMNYMSWPCQFGVMELQGSFLDEILGALKLTRSELISYRNMPMDHIQDLIDSQIPVILVAGDSDHCVPYIENGILLEKAYKASQLDFELYLKPGCDHHPHGLEDPSPIVDFIEKH